jgi:DedD protein
LTNQTQDDGFHEIQLNGKQLVFLFMAATVVSVVIFLCGVLVGRGVRAERAGVAEDTTALGTVSAAETTPQQPAPVSTPPPAGSDPTAAAPPPAVDDLSYFNRLEKSNQPAEHLKPVPEQPEQSARAAAPPPVPPPKESPQPVQRAASAPEPAGQGYALQVAALRERNEADAVANRLVSKGYTAYVLAPASGTPSVFRVRIGKFRTRREAETVATKLQQEEQFKPWITR